jgi:hypothetical protein
MPTRREMDLKQANDVEEMKKDIKSLIAKVDSLIEKIEDSKVKKIAAKKGK